MSEPPPQIQQTIQGNTVVLRFNREAYVLTTRRGDSETELLIRPRVVRRSKQEPSRPKSTSPARGRGETVLNLIKAGLLRAETNVTLTVGAEVHRATINADGRFEVGRRIRSSPSSAAKHVGVKEANAWYRWRLPDGSPLADLRWRLRARRFDAEQQDDIDATDSAKQSLASAWVEHALQNGLDPGLRDASAVEVILRGSGTDSSDTGLSGHRRHLDKWFAFAEERFEQYKFGLDF